MKVRMKVRMKKSKEGKRGSMKISPGKKSRNNPWLLAGLPLEQNVCESWKLLSRLQSKDTQQDEMKLATTCNLPTFKVPKNLSPVWLDNKAYCLHTNNHLYFYSNCCFSGLFVARHNLFHLKIYYSQIFSFDESKKGTKDL